MNQTITDVGTKILEATFDELLYQDSMIYKHLEAWTRNIQETFLDTSLSRNIFPCDYGQSFIPVEPVEYITLTFIVTPTKVDPEPEFVRTKPTTKSLFLKYGPGRRK